MLSIEECRALIPDGDKMPDKQIEELRNSLYELAELALEVYFEKNGNKSTPANRTDDN